MIILGIDPGFKRIGYGAISSLGSKIEYLEGGLFSMQKNNQSPIPQISSETLRLLLKFKPDLVVVEKIFFTRNQKTGIRVAEARGAILSVILENKFNLMELTPNQIKMCVSGSGSTDKKGVSKMVRLITGCPDLKLIDDAMDAIAGAIAGASLNKISKHVDRRSS